MCLGRPLEACQAHGKVALEHNSKSTKYELEGSYDDLVHELLSFTTTTTFASFLRTQCVTMLYPSPHYYYLGTNSKLFFIFFQRYQWIC